MLNINRFQSLCVVSELILLLIVWHVHTICGLENALRINTDLTAGVIDSGRGGGGGGGGDGDIIRSDMLNDAVASTPAKGHMNFNVMNVNGVRIINDSAAAIQSSQSSPALSSSQSSPALSSSQSSSSIMINGESSANVCVREETYVEQLRVPIVQPVRIRTANWCFGVPPRCSSYKNEMREVIKLQNITKTRTIRFCCAGYEGNISVTDTVCKPICLGGCGRGFCQLPDVCSCEAGYTGKHCTQRCDHDHWGMKCGNECQCRNGAACDNKSGLCHCTTGWAGEFCELPCPTGTYGVMCRKACECAGSSSCHPQSGACEHAPNATHAMIETLNSTIANITHNLDRLAKNIVNIVTTVKPTHVDDKSDEQSVHEFTTKKSVPEVIVIKQSEANEHPPPKIIVHGTSADLLENIHHAAAIGGKSAEVIHVIAGWPGTAAASNTAGHMNLTHAGDDLDLASFARDAAAAAAAAAGEKKKSRPPLDSHNPGDAMEHETSLLTLLLLVLLIVLIAVAGSFLYVYRRYQVQRRRVEAVLSARNSETFTSQLSTSGGGGIGIGVSGMGLGVGVGTNQLPSELTTHNGLDTGLTLCKSAFPKPLPDLPAFTQNVRNKIEEPEFYDSPSNNSSIKTPSYTYGRKESLYSMVMPKSRKGSQESHLYDEIRYHTPSPTPLSIQSINKTAATIYVPATGPVAMHTLAAMPPSSSSLPSQSQPLHISQLIIPPSAHTAKYIQVPQMLQRQSSQSSAHKLEHM